MSKDIKDIDIKSTLNLPETEFKMKANLPVLEKEILNFWEEIDIYETIQKKNKDRESFVLHDGPPYANGHLHMGTAYNKILKDIINRTRQMMGFNSTYRPGWDCHGLPIEWKVEEEFNSQGLKKSEISPKKFRDRCREYASKWIKIQAEEFKRCGVLGDWKNPYLTMSFSAESTIAAELLKFVQKGDIFRSARPVMWSPVEQTALAEAEIEYHDKKSTEILVKYPIRNKENEYVVIWTTTPWTIPCSLGITYGDEIKYSLYEVVDSAEDNWAKKGEHYLLADNCAEFVKNKARIDDWKKIKEVTIDEIKNIICDHPLKNRGFTHDIHLFTGEHVTDDAGSGFVHCAPGHGVEDFAAYRNANFDIDLLPIFVDELGEYTEHAKEFKGLDVISTNAKTLGKDGKANEAVLQALAEEGTIIARSVFTHSYPHSWRSKAPIIYRLTPQWFLRLGRGENSLRQIALDNIETVNFIPPITKNRLKTMVENRPDWLISRQRAWGTPITIFAEKETGLPLNDIIVHKRVIEKINKEGIETWFSTPSSEFLEPEYNSDEYIKVNDILDVWFDSGSTHSFVLEGKNGLGSPADLYIEGTDQHRGWFQSSLLQSCGTRGRSPFKSLLTHGFVLDQKGRKMSKSLGNVIAPKELIDKHGVDILRLWVASSDYSEDLRIGDEVIKSSIDSYRKIRNTFRYMLGAIGNTNPSADIGNISDIDKFVLHRLYEISEDVTKAYNDYNFKKATKLLFEFLSFDLSAYYFDIRKDVLYCDAADSEKRSTTISIIHILLNSLLRLYAPILSFTCEEIFQKSNLSSLIAKSENMGNDLRSVHLLDFQKLPAEFYNKEIGEKFTKINEIRDRLMVALEQSRNNKFISTSLEAELYYFDPSKSYNEIENIAWDEIALISSINFIDKEREGEPSFEKDGIKIWVVKSSKDKCQRCWRFIDVNEHDLCERCDEVVKSFC